MFCGFFFLFSILKSIFCSGVPQSPGERDARAHCF
jgi:hypothetical protein